LADVRLSHRLEGVGRGDTVALMLATAAIEAMYAGRG